MVKREKVGRSGIKFVGGEREYLLLTMDLWAGWEENYKKDTHSGVGLILRCAIETSSSSKGGTGGGKTIFGGGIMLVGSISFSNVWIQRWSQGGRGCLL